jgi:hypothetical protein
MSADLLRFTAAIGILERNQPPPVCPIFGGKADSRELPGMSHNYPELTSNSLPCCGSERTRSASTKLCTWADTCFS